MINVASRRFSSRWFDNDRTGTYFNSKIYRATENTKTTRNKAWCWKQKNVALTGGEELLSATSWSASVRSSFFSSVNRLPQYHFPPKVRPSINRRSSRRSFPRTAGFCFLFCWQNKILPTLQYGLWTRTFCRWQSFLRSGHDKCQVVRRQCDRICQTTIKVLARICFF